MMNSKGFHLSVTAVSKARNHSIVAKSAYNSGSRLVSELTGIVHDYTSNSKDKTLFLVNNSSEKYVQVIDGNLVHTALITPVIAGAIAVTRERFWNAQFGTEIDGVAEPHLNE